jgi:general secretion pathway protein B
MGAAAPMAPQTQPQQAGPAPGSAGRMPVQNSMSTPAPAVPPASPPAAAAPAAPAPAPVTPPFNANAARGPASAPAAAPQQPVKGLPADAPKLVISGGVYSANPARRMLIVNGQVVREGADLGSGVVLQEVKAESAVLDYKGTRYTVLF